MVSTQEGLSFVSRRYKDEIISSSHLELHFSTQRTAFVSSKETLHSFVSLVGRPIFVAFSCHTDVVNHWIC